LPAPSPADKAQSSTSKVEALALLLDQAGLDADDITPALLAFAAAKKATAAPPEQGRSIYQDKELIYDDESSFIYKRGDTKSGKYYLRIYDPVSRKPFIKSLKTTDRIRAITTAREIYQDIKGRIHRGEKLKTITSSELVKIYLDKESKKVTDIPKEGITPSRFRMKQYYASTWLEYIKLLGYEATPIDRIKPERTREFALWFKNKPRKDGRNEPYSINLVNNCISEILKIYKDVAVRDHYISRDLIPEFDRLREQPDQGLARDIFTDEEYEIFWRYCHHKWIKEPGIKKEEKQKRIIFYNALGILVNSGLRPKELLGLKWNEITFLSTDTKEQQQERMKIKVRRTNSKTGVERTVVCPITKRVERIKQAYQSLGVEILPTDFLLMNPLSPHRKSYTREMLANRLHKILELSGLKDQLDREGKKINLYSFRHQWFTWRLRYGNVPIHLLAKAGGNSVEKIQSTYSHIKVEQQADLLTKAQGFARAAEVDLGLNNQFWYEE
jgi:integrase